MATFGYMFAKIIKKHNIGVRKLAEILDVSPSYICDLKHRKRDILSPMKLAKFCQYFGYDIKRAVKLCVKFKYLIYLRKINKEYKEAQIKANL